jgi:heme exporter protein A
MLEAKDLQCERGGRELFRALSFLLAAGEALRVEGANGSGKTSLLRILCGLLPPTGGRVLWKGAPVAGLREEYAGQLVYLGHAPAVKDELTAAENLAIACRLAGEPVTNYSVDEALQRFGLSASRSPLRRLSQGQRRRAALARLALSARRPLWLLDEPFSALDGAGVSLLNALILEHAGRGGCVVLTTHQEAGIAAAHVLRLG